ncbi:MAG: hypothetical protein U5J83_15675 [Bryobacterales bacterium]|nr:hypothetical protein [Bryobacterales bacterium]
MLAIRDYMKGLAGNFDVVERAREERKSGLLINSKKETRRIVLSQYHVGRDRIVEELKRRGVRDYAEAVRQGR